MSKKTMVVTVCNGCLAELSGEDEDLSEEYVVTAGRKQYEIDLCHVCNETFFSFLNVPSPPKKVAKKTAAPARKSKNEVPCPKCDRMFANAHGLQVHTARSHKKK